MDMALINSSRQKDIKEVIDNKEKLLPKIFSLGYSNIDVCISEYLSAVEVEAAAYIKAINAFYDQQILAAEKKVGYKIISTRNGTLYVKIEDIFFVNGFAFVNGYDIFGNIYVGFIDTDFEEVMLTFNENSTWPITTLGFEPQDKRFNVRKIDETVYSFRILNFKDGLTVPCYTYHTVELEKTCEISVAREKRYEYGYLDRWNDTIEGEEIAYQEQLRHEQKQKGRLPRTALSKRQKKLLLEKINK